MAKFVITNARIVDDGTVTEGDLLVQDDRIARVDGRISIPDGASVVDANGRYLVPGMIDDQVHFREPGVTQKAEIATESAAAVAGGITSFMDMPNVKPSTTTRENLAAKYRRGSEVARANFGFYFGGTNTNIEEIKALQVNEACGVKVFMGASTGNMLVDDPATLEAIFEHSPLLVATHCEDTPTVLANEAKFKAQYGDDVPVTAHPLIRSEEACWLSSSLAVGLAKKHDTPLHVLHLTTARELELFTAGPVADKRITLEACVHHLYFSQDDYLRKGSFIKCNPAVKRAEDRAALLQAVRDDVVDIIATDHAPHLLEEKERKYIETPAGMPLVQDAYPSLLEQIHRGQLTIEKVVQKTAHAPAQRFKVRDRGYLREGYFADLVLLDMDGETARTREQVLYKCGWSPFEGEVLRGRIASTWVNGALAYDGTRVIDVRAGRRLEHGAQR